MIRIDLEITDRRAVLEVVTSIRCNNPQAEAKQVLTLDGVAFHDVGVEALDGHEVDWFDAFDSFSAVPALPSLPIGVMMVRSSPWSGQSLGLRERCAV